MISKPTQKAPCRFLRKPAKTTQNLFSPQAPQSTATQRVCRPQKSYGFHPFHCYGLCKVVGEEYCNMYRDQYGLDVAIVRFANVYGLRCHGVIHDFLDKLAENPGKLEIIGTGMQSRDFVHVSDVVDALVTVGSDESANGQIYNMGFGTTTKIIDLAKLMLKILSLQNKTFVTTTGVSWQGDINTIWFDILQSQKRVELEPESNP